MTRLKNTYTLPNVTDLTNVNDFRVIQQESVLLFKLEMLLEKPRDVLANE